MRGSRWLQFDSVAESRLPSRKMIRGELALDASLSRHNLVFGAIRMDRHHDAAIRIDGEAPGRQSHSHLRHDSAMGVLGFPPPRTVVGGSSRDADEGRNCLRCERFLLQQFNHAAHRTTPCGTSPVVTYRQSAISSLRASATIMVVRFLPPATRAWYHCARALSF